MAKKSFKRVILYARQHRASQGVNETLQRLVHYLQNKSVEVFIDIDTATSFDLTLPVLKREEMDEEGDLIIVVGGDGSLLSAARMAIQVNVPVIGINRGRLGFLTDISPQQLDTQLDQVLAGHYSEEKRFLIYTRIHDGSNTYYQGMALNDVVLSRGNEPHLIEFEIHIDEQFVTDYRSDGLIVSTPTGSTAYALSAGGPILHPKINAIIMVPMFSHSLSSRPFLMDGDAQLELRISKGNDRDLQISCDGHESGFVKPGQSVAIKKHDQQLRLLHPPKYHYYDTLRIKLGWGLKPQG